MNSLYKINGTTNIHEEQNTGVYTDPNFWPTFQDDYEGFKNQIKDCVENVKPLTVLRVGHAEYCLLTYILNNRNNLQGKQIVKGALPRHYTCKQKLIDFIDFYESFNTVDILTTQMGNDFKAWLNDMRNFQDRYNEYKQRNEIETLFKNTNLFTETYKNYQFNELIKFPLDIVYGIIANKWIFKEFKNQIGFIGNDKKLDSIKNLMTYPKYQEYIGCEYFTDYIGIPQRQAVEAGITEQLLESVKKSTCKIFLIGAGVCKLKFYNKLKEQKNCVYIDVGHGLDAVAGIADNTRPYFGNWQNYKIRNYDYSNIDYCAGPSGRTGITL